MSKSSKKSKKSEKHSSTSLDTESPKTKPMTGLKLSREPQAFTVDEWDWNRLIFSEPQKEKFDGGFGYRIKINYKYSNDTMGPAIVSLDKHYCFGVQQDNLDKDGNVRTDKDGKPIPLKGYRMPLVMTSQTQTSPDEITEVEQKELEFFDSWNMELLRYCLENKAAIGQKNKNEGYFEGVIKSILYRKGGDDPEKGVAPKLYADLIYYRNKKEIGTEFYGPGEKKLDPLSKQMRGHMHVYANIRFDSIYVGSTGISVKHKVYDCTVMPVKKEPRKRLARPNLEPVDTGADDEEQESGEAEGEAEGEGEEQGEDEDEGEGEGEEEMLESE